MTRSRTELAALIDHTLLRPEATRADVAALCREAVEHAFAAACVSPVHAGTVVAALDGMPVRSCCVVGFPSGAHSSLVKSSEARAVADAGVDEIDMVIDLGGLIGHGGASVASEVGAVRAAIPPAVVLKVIIETAVLTDPLIVEACTAAVDAGADFVKTSTGVHPAGGASPHHVALMRATVGSGIGVKASGGVRTLADMLMMLEAGASRIGTSSGIAILDELGQPA